MDGVLGHGQLNGWTDGYTNGVAGGHTDERTIERHDGRTNIYFYRDRDVKRNVKFVTFRLKEA